LTWGNGDKYRLGHGDITKEYAPRLVEAFRDKVHTLSISNIPTSFYIDISISISDIPTSFYIDISISISTRTTCT
jgi:hypothetical protein